MTARSGLKIIAWLPADSVSFLSLEQTSAAGSAALIDVRSEETSQMPTCPSRALAAMQAGRQIVLGRREIPYLVRAVVIDINEERIPHKGQLSASAVGDCFRANGTSFVSQREDGQSLSLVNRLRNYRIIFPTYRRGDRR